MGNGPPPHLQKAGVARTSRTQVVAIRAPAAQTLPPVAGEGKLPTAIPIFQPWSRCHRDYAGGLMTSVETKRKHWQRSWSRKVSRPARQQHATLILAPSLQKSWARRTLASRACGDFQTWSSTRVEKVAHMHTPRVQNPPAMQQVTRTSKPIANQQALDLQETMRPWSTRLQNFDAAGIPQPTQETLLRAVIQLKARVAATIQTHLRCVSQEGHQQRV